jgi:anti-sigma-K factor RskA
MTHEELSELYELYVLGVLDPEEKAELEEHLARNCSQCQAGVRNALAMGTFFASMPDPIAPPKRLRRRVLASVGVEPKSSRFWIGGLAVAAAALAVAVLALNLTLIRRSEDLSQARAEIARTTSEVSRLETAFQFLNAPDTEQVTFGKGPQGRVFVNPRRGVLLIASNLPPAPSGKLFEMWIIPKGGAPQPAGLFRADAQGNAMYIWDRPVDRAHTSAVAVTIEPEAGSPAPTSTPILAATLSD